MSLFVFHQVLAMIPVFVLLFLSGVTLGWLPIVLYLLKGPDNTLSLNHTAYFWLAAVQQVGRIASTIPSGIIMDMVGRKNVMLISGSTFLLGWLVAFSVYSYAGLFLSNLLIGTALGVANTSCQIYTAEIASAKLRGIFHAINSFSYNLGYVIISLLALELHYRSITMIIFFTTFLFFVPFYWLPETPYYLANRGRNAKADKSLQWLRSGQEREATANEFAKIVNAVKTQSNRIDQIRNALRDPDSRNCVCMVLFLNFVCTFTGFVTIRLYSTTSLPKTVFIDNTIHYPLIMACIQLVSSFISPFLIERFPRRILYICASSLLTVTLVAISILLTLQNNLNVTVKYGDEILVSLNLFYYVVYSMTVVTLLFVSKGELLPQSMRAIGGGMIAMAQAIANLIVTVQYDLVAVWLGAHCNYYFYSFHAILVGVSVYLFLPETRGQTLATIHDTIKQRRRSTKTGLELNFSNHSEDTETTNGLLNGSKSNSNAIN